MLTFVSRLLVQENSIFRHFVQVLSVCIVASAGVLSVHGADAVVLTEQRWLSGVVLSWGDAVRGLAVRSPRAALVQLALFLLDDSVGLFNDVR